MRVLIFTVVALLCSTPTAMAQGKPSLHIMIEELPKDAKACGLYKDTLRTPAVLTLRKNGVEVDDADTSVLQGKPYLYVSANIMFLEQVNSCTYNVKVSVNVFGVPIQRGAFRSEKYEDILLCNESRLGVAGIDRVPAKYLSSAVEISVNNCLAKLRY